MRPSILPTLALILMVMGAGAFAAWFVMSQEEPAAPPTVAFEPAEDADTSRQRDETRAVEPVIKPVRPETDNPAKSAPGTRGDTAERKPDATMNKAPAPSPKPEMDKQRDELKRAEVELDRIRNYIDRTGIVVEQDAGPKVPFSATIRGTVVDGGNVPVVGASVHGSSFDTPGAATGLLVSRIAVAGGASGPVLATTDGAGEFTVRIDKQVREGAKVNVTLSAKAPGFAPSPSQQVMLAQGDEKTGIKLVLPGAGSVTGRVIDASGGGVAGARVSLSQNGGFRSAELVGVAGLYGANSHGGHSAVTDAGGNFKIADLAEGRYRASVSANGWRQTSGPTEVLVTAGQETSLSPDFAMKAASQIRISLRDADGNALARPIMLSLKSETAGSQMKRLAPADGTFTWNDAPVGAFTVTVLVSGFVPVTTQCTVIDGLPTELGTFTLEKTAPQTPALPPSDG